jgi:hypothetical protein
VDKWIASDESTRSNRLARNARPMHLPMQTIIDKPRLDGSRRALRTFAPSLLLRASPTGRRILDGGGGGAAQACGGGAAQACGGGGAAHSGGGG